MKTDEAKPKALKEYFPPKIVHTETIETRAVVCTKANEACGAGPINS